MLHIFQIFRDKCMETSMNKISITSYLGTYVGGGHGCDHIVVGFTTICAICSNSVHDEVYSIQHYMIKFVSNFRQVGGFPRWRHFS
jgi:hypothetical protein